MLSIDDILDAAHRINRWLDPTPTIENPALNELANRRVLLKLESLNVTGSFKIRGAVNALLQLEDAGSSAGVLAISSGNHAQAVAQAASWMNVKSTIVMPFDAPGVKRSRTEALADKVVYYDRYEEDREQIGRRIAKESGATLIHPFDQYPTMSGQGTVGLELCQAASERNLELELLAVPCSGGGLAAGVATATRHYFENATVLAVEPEGYDDTARSLRAGHRVALESKPANLCDALQVPIPGEYTFPLNQNLLSGAVSVTDQEVLTAMAFAAKTLKVVLEPAGAAALAALLAGRLPGGHGTVGLVLSGSNVDPSVLRRALEGGLPSD